MFKHLRQIAWLGWPLALMIGLVGCSLFERDNLTGPTAPAQSGVQLANFFVSEAEGENFGVYTDFDMFLVKVPAGDYKLKYTTSLGEFVIVFRATAPSVMSVGLISGDRVITASLEQGTIPATAEPVYQENTLILFCWPDHGPEDVTTVFTADSTLPEVSLVENAMVVQGENVEILAGFQEPFKVNATVTEDGFSVYLPKGDYRLEYSLKTGGIFQILFRVIADQAMLDVPLLNPEDEVDDVFIQRGMIPVEAEPVGTNDAGDIIFFYLPGVGDFDAVGFIKDPDFNLLLIIEDGVVNTDIDNDGEDDTDIIGDMKDRYTISTQAGEGGTIRPKSSTVPAGASRSFKIIPDRGFRVGQVKIDGQAVGVQMLGNGQGHYVFHKVSEDHVLEATFAEEAGAKP